MNKNINRREQIIFKQDYDKNSGDKFITEYKQLISLMLSFTAYK